MSETGDGRRKTGDEAGRPRREAHAHERLDAYQLSRRLAVELYRETAMFPPDEKYGLTSQIRRAAVAIPANIAEGAAKRSKKEFSRYLLIARGSAAELRLLLDIAHEIGHLPDGPFWRYEGELDRVFAMASGLIRRSDSR